MQLEIPAQSGGEWVTLMFTDIEGSTGLVERFGKLYFDILERHFGILRRITQHNRGHVVVRHSDAFFASFSTASDALTAGAHIQTAFYNEEWPAGTRLRVRMGLHTGEATPVPDPKVGYVGMDVHRAARIAEAAAGGQILFSSTTRSELPEAMEPSMGRVHFLGRHRFKDLPFPESIYELLVPGLPQEFPPIRSITNLPTNLPRAVTSFVGRRKEIDEICGFLRQESTRILTLTGPGGAGKTRLSVETGRKLLDRFADGVFQVRLGGISEDDLVCSAIAQALHVPDYPGRSVIDSLMHFIADRNVLLILDNFEQVIGAARDLSGIVEACPNLKLLVTSREALRLSAEREYRIPTMQIPDADEQYDEMVRNDCVQLFCDRASASATFALNAQTAPVVARICRRLDGLPLAIELAASRLRVLDVAELATRLDDSLAALGRGPRDIDSRHQTLREAILWSHDLLDETEQCCFRRVSIFRGGFDLTSAEAVCRPDPAADPNMLEAISSLVEKNLITARAAEGRSRFRMLEPIREFAFGQLRDSGELERFADGHRDHFLALAEDMAPHFVRSGQRRAVSTVLLDIDNIRAALGWCLERSDLGRASRFLRALLWLWIPRGWFSEGRSWADQALAAAASGERTIDAGILNDVSGWLQMISGDYAGALPKFRRAHEIFTALESPVETARSMITLGITTAISTGGADGPQLIVDALQRCRDIGDDHGAGLALVALGEGARAGGDPAAASAYYDQALDLMRRSDDQYWIGALLLNMAHVLMQQDDVHRTKQHLAEVVKLADEFDYPMMINLYVALKGELLCREKEFADAARLFGAASSMVNRIGVQFEPADQAEFEKYLNVTRERLGPGAFQQAYDEGFAWSAEEAVAFAGRV